MRPVLVTQWFALQLDDPGSIPGESILVIWAAGPSLTRMLESTNAACLAYGPGTCRTAGDLEVCSASQIWSGAGNRICMYHSQRVWCCTLQRDSGRGTGETDINPGAHICSRFAPTVTRFGCGPLICMHDTKPQLHCCHDVVP